MRNGVRMEGQGITMKGKGEWLGEGNEGRECRAGE